MTNPSLKPPKEIPVSQRIRMHNEGELLYVAHNPNGIAVEADFVHPLIAVDFDADHKIVGFSATGKNAIDAVLEIYKDHRDSGDEKLLDRLALAHELTSA